MVPLKANRNSLAVRVGLEGQQSRLDGRIDGSVSERVRVAGQRRAGHALADGTADALVPPVVSVRPPPVKPAATRPANATAAMVLVDLHDLLSGR
jgi:hypothetical protein